MIKKFKSFINESNVTTDKNELFLNKYFNLESKDIEILIQDFLDDNEWLNFEVSVINKKMICIIFFEEKLDDLNDKYEFPNDVLEFLKSVMSRYGLLILKKGDEEVYYATKYISIIFIENVFRKSE